MRIEVIRRGVSKMNTARMTDYVNAHSPEYDQKIAIDQGNNTLLVLNRYAQRDEDGNVTLGCEWEIIPATWSAIYAWLGY
jgi:hypothetical protein